MNEIAPGPTWLPWHVVFNEANRRWEREVKPLTSHPAVLELAQNATFVERARLYWWSVQEPTSVAQTSDNWPPDMKNAHKGVGEYFARVYERNKMHGTSFSEPTSLATLIATALELSVANPLLEF